MVLALADGEVLFSGREGRHDGAAVESVSEVALLERLLERLEDGKSLYRKALVHMVLAFDVTRTQQNISNVILIPSPESSNVTTMKTVMCDVMALLLSSMHDLAVDLRKLPTVESPSMVAPAKPSNDFHDIANRTRQRMSMPTSASPDAQVGRSQSSLSQSSTSSTTNDRSPSKARPSILNHGSEQSSRDVSRDRHSVIESGSALPQSPRLAVTKGRVHVAIGALHMQAGRWQDAMKSLSEGVATARANSDNLWHARGLECLLICMLSFVRCDMPFEIPSVCLPLAEKRSKAEPTFYTPETANANSSPSTHPVSEAPPASVQHLVSLFTDIVSTILTLYARASTFSAEKLPQLLLCEVRIRLITLLSVINLRRGTLDQQGLDMIFSGRGQANDRIGLHTSPNTAFRKDELADMLLKTIPEPLEKLPLSNAIDILLSISMLLSQLGLARKQAFMLKEVLSTMAPGLVEARKIGAAEMGIHPSAGLPLLHSASMGGSPNDRHSVTALLSVVAEMYGVPYGRNKLMSVNSTSIEAIGVKMRTWAYVRNSADATLMMEILRSCINICEALPDLAGVLAFAVQLMDTARNVITLPPSHFFGPPSLSQEEQLRLLNTIKRTVAAAGRLGHNDMLAEYWDDFLIRGIEPLEPPDQARLTIHSALELAAATTPSIAIKKDPFIYSSFAKASAKSNTNTILTKDDIAHFAVILQNPFEFDVEIDRISLVSEGCEFSASDHSIVLGHYCSQKFIMSGRPTSHGTLKITGCWARVRHCRGRTFRIFSKQWVPEQPVKVKRRRQTKEQLHPSDADVNERPALEVAKDPEADMASLTVLGAQPLLSVINTTLTQPALMLLEGETKFFKISLHNASPTATADLLLFTYQDSATTQLQDALAARELSPAELYELQLQLAGKPSLRWVSEDDHADEPSIPAGTTSTFKFEIFGKPGLLSGVIQVDYAHVGVPRSEIRENFYTRQLRYPISVTVNGAIEIPRCNILPFSGDFAWRNQQRIDQRTRPASRLSEDAKSRKDDNQLVPLLSRLGLGSHDYDHCLLLLDIRNVWPHPLSISIQIREGTSKTPSPTDPWRGAYTVHETLQPSHVTRVVLLLPRLFVPDSHAPIPLLGNQRQFVVSASKLSAEGEAASRELFWHREELLKYIRGSWREDSTGREGIVNIRKGIRLNARMIEFMRLDEIDVEFSVRAFNMASKSEKKSAVGKVVQQTGRSHFILQPNAFATLIVKLRNRSAERIHLLLRLQPSLRDQPHNVALDLSKRFAWTGMLQRALHPPLEGGEVREAELGIAALCEGDFEIGATLEELHVGRRSETEHISSGSLAPPKRRIWHARDPCLIDAVESRNR